MIKSQQNISMTSFNMFLAQLVTWQGAMCDVTPSTLSDGEGKHGNRVLVIRLSTAMVSAAYYPNYTFNTAKCVSFETKFLDNVNHYT